MYKIRQYKHLAENQTVKNFVLKNHYLHSLLRGNKFVFAIYEGRKIKGVAAFGTPVGRSVQARYGKGKLVLELKRFVLKDCAPNTASWFMSKCIKVLKELNTIGSIITYADPKVGHTGSMYKACNYKYEGKQRWPTRIVRYKGKEHHLRAVYQQSKIGIEMQGLIEQGKLKSVSMPLKHIFTYNLEKK